MVEITLEVSLKTGVPGSPGASKTIKVSASSGSATLEAGKLVVPSPSTLRVRYANSGSGDYSLVAGGLLRMGDMEIPIPCIIAVSKPCFRIQVIIPGVDEDVEVPPGSYDILLVLNWGEASGRGVHKLSVELDVKPSSTE
ncbi:MAG: hypothetical protein JHC12_04265 [Thermogladius sp.]|nr:hypothetical protein [Thermogladius sp.]